MLAARERSKSKKIRSVKDVSKRQCPSSFPLTPEEKITEEPTEEPTAGKTEPVEGETTPAEEGAPGFGVTPALQDSLESSTSSGGETKFFELRFFLALLSLNYFYLTLSSFISISGIFDLMCIFICARFYINWTIYVTLLMLLELFFGY